MNMQATLPTTETVTVRTSTQSMPSRVRMLSRIIRLYSKLSPEGAGKLVNSLWFTPNRTGAGSKYEHLLKKATTHTSIRIGTNEISVYSWGHGPTVIFAHGWSGSGLQFGGMIEPFLRLGYRVVAFDMPGHGRSQGLKTDVFEMAEAITAVAELFGGSYAVVAHSLGAVATIVAQRHGLKAQKLVLLAPPESLEMVIDLFGKQLDIPQKTLRIHRGLLERKFGEKLWEKLNMPLQTSQLTTPGLVISDVYDQQVPISSAEAIVRDWKNARILKTQSLGHYRILKDRKVLQDISQFLHQQ